MKPIIKVSNVNFTYNKGKSNEYQALIDVNLEIFPEEFIIILGPSGCGKSSLLNIISGLEKPDSGEIQVMDRNLMTMSSKEFAMYHRTELGMIFQAYNLISSLTVLDNVALPQIFINTSKSKRDRWAKTLLERFGILKHMKKIPTELSGGQQQRIGIARSIVNNPSLILADEPVGNLDSESAKNVLDILCDLNEHEKKTVIMVTHNPENTIVGDRIIHMKDGVIVREEINKHKGRMSDIVEKKDDKESLHRSPTEEMSEMLRMYNGLSTEQINILIMPYKSKMFVNHFISSKNYEETKTFEDVIQRRLLGTVSQEELLEILHRPSREGGVGFDTRTADKILRRINRVIRLAYYVNQKARQKKNPDGTHDKISASDKAKKVLEYLLNTCYDGYVGHLDEIQINRLEHAIKDRIAGEILKNDFYNYLDKPFKESGVGLNSKTAKTITDELELLLVISFGVAQNERIKTIQSSMGAMAVSQNRPVINAKAAAVSNIENKEDKF